MYIVNDEKGIKYEVNGDIITLKKGELLAEKIITDNIISRECVENWIKAGTISKVAHIDRVKTDKPVTTKIDKPAKVKNIIVKKGVK